MFLSPQATSGEADQSSQRRSIRRALAENVVDVLVTQPSPGLIATLTVIYVILAEADFLYPSRSMYRRLEEEVYCLDALLSVGIDLSNLGKLLLAWTQTDNRSSQGRQLPAPYIIAEILDSPDSSISVKENDLCTLDALHSIGMLLQDVANYFPLIDIASLENTSDILCPNEASCEGDVEDPTFVTAPIWERCNRSIRQHIKEAADRPTSWEHGRSGKMSWRSLKISNGSRVVAISDTVNMNRVVCYATENHDEYEKFLKHTLPKTFKAKGAWERKRLSGGRTFFDFMFDGTVIPLLNVNDLSVTANAQLDDDVDEDEMSSKNDEDEKPLSSLSPIDLVSVTGQPRTTSSSAQFSSSPEEDTSVPPSQSSPHHGLTNAISLVNDDDFM